eukprot:TRINITY_DN21513_c0_g1_i1.p1 TRINITY_DN21513_c0_g1~~TRINITY_DN21513_c0_g1_i1.p1  ORF type:complete len:184 (-),score=30.65 TRINITY_DN21513_c0_g1_i1:207-758(-)
MAQLVRGKSCDGSLIKLSALDLVMMGGADSSIEFALFFRDASDRERLVSSLEVVLDSFPNLAGRVVRKGDEVCIECSNAGVPVTFEAKDSPAPPQEMPYPDSLFDLAKAVPPPADMSVGEAPLRIRVTTFVDGQVIAFSFNHVLGDAASLNLFLVSWSDAYRGTEAPITVIHDRVGFYPQTPA